MSNVKDSTSIPVEFKVNTTTKLPEETDGGMVQQGPPSVSGANPVGIHNYDPISPQYQVCKVCNKPEAEPLHNQQGDGPLPSDEKEQTFSDVTFEKDGVTYMTPNDEIRRENGMVDEGITYENPRQDRPAPQTGIGEDRINEQALTVENDTRGREVQGEKWQDFQLDTIVDLLSAIQELIESDDVSPAEREYADSILVEVQNTLQAKRL